MDRFAKGSSAFFILTTSLVDAVPDIDTIDNTLGDSLRMLFATLSNIIGAIVLIAIIVPRFLIASLSSTCRFYVASARELKRLGK